MSMMGRTRGRVSLATSKLQVRGVDHVRAAEGVGDADERERSVDAAAPMKQDSSIVRWITSCVGSRDSSLWTHRGSARSKSATRSELHCRGAGFVRTRFHPAQRTIARCVHRLRPKTCLTLGLG